MTPGQALALWLNIPNLEAARLRQALTLHRFKLDPSLVHDLVLAETDDQEAAHKARCEQIKALMEAEGDG